MGTVATKPRPTTAEPAAKAAPAAPDDTYLVVHLDTSVIVRDACNARTEDTEPDDELISSVKSIGVQDPISVRPLPGGKYGAFKGWRRTQAAQIANATAAEDKREVRTVKAFVRPDLVGRDAWTRFLSLVENEQREGMTARDKVKSVELALVGMDEVEQKQAAAALGVGRGALKYARKAQKLDDAALRRASAGGMDLEQTAQLAEVHDFPRAETRLQAALRKDHAQGKGGRGHWDQEFALILAEQADSKALEAARGKLKEAKIPLLRQPDAYGWGEKDTARPLSELTTPLGNPLTEDNHSGCPGHSARLDGEHQPVWHCSDPKAHGHKVRPEAKKAKKPLSEKESAERRKVIAGNRAWRAARTPRQTYITALVRGRTLPEEARLFALRVLFEVPPFYARWADKRELKDLARFLGAKAPESTNPFDLVAGMPKNREGNALFALAAAACEFDLREPKAWTNLSPNQARWLLLLEELGGKETAYTLSEVEAEAVARHRPRKAKPAA